jgi:hypothetical protein
MPLKRCCIPLWYLLCSFVASYWKYDLWRTCMHFLVKPTHYCVSSCSLLSPFWILLLLIHVVSCRNIFSFRVNCWWVNNMLCDLQLWSVIFSMQKT